MAHGQNAADGTIRKRICSSDLRSLWYPHIRIPRWAFEHSMDRFTVIPWQFVGGAPGMVMIDKSLEDLKSRLPVTQLDPDILTFGWMMSIA
jgi:hypothetical protein